METPLGTIVLTQARSMDLLAECKRIEDASFEGGGRSGLVARARELGAVAEACVEQRDLDRVARMYAAVGLIRESRRVRDLAPHRPAHQPAVLGPDTGVQIHRVAALESTVVDRRSPRPPVWTWSQVTAPLVASPAPPAPTPPRSITLVRPSEPVARASAPPPRRRSHVSALLISLAVGLGVVAGAVWAHADLGEAPASSFR